MKNVSKTQFEASDGRTYKFMGSQWAELLRSGKTGLVAKRTISAELNRLAGIAKPKKSRKRVKKTEEVEIESISKIIDPSSEQIDSDDQQKKRFGVFWLYHSTNSHYAFYYRNFKNLPKRVDNVFSRNRVYF